MFFACSKTYTPKPHGFMRIDFPEKAYQSFDTTFPYSFMYPKYGHIEDLSKIKEPYFINISFPDYNAKIHITYKKIKNNLSQYLEESRTFAYKHTIKATAINEKNYINYDKKIFGTVYEIKGNAASFMQFYLTDSNKNFIRGALYFNVESNYDSLLPAINFFSKDVIHLIETFSWK
jgi:gliding motility-associated lipoprotein GldD